MRLIGLSGYARSGKDEAAKVLVEEYGFKRIAFADKLRDFLYALDPIVTVKRGETPINVKQGETVKRLYIDDGIRATIPVSIEVRVSQVIDEHGWDGYKETEYGAEIRGLLQRLGTEAGRQTLWDSIWIDAALHDLDPNGNYVVTDVRFPNEAAAITERGGRLVRIVRDGVGPANMHASETSLDDYPFMHGLRNNGTLEEFRANVKTYFAPRY
jgi:hypothetical protein